MCKFFQRSKADLRSEKITIKNRNKTYNYSWHKMHKNRKRKAKWRKTEQFVHK